MKFYSKVPKLTTNIGSKVWDRFIVFFHVLTGWFVRAYPDKSSCFPKYQKEFFH